jgi:hypothetical protein
MTDPFERGATVTYASTGQLETLTDTLGLTSRLVYGPSDTVLFLQTRCGTTLPSTRETVVSVLKR